MGTTLTNQNSILEEIKSRLNSGNASYHSVQNLLSSSFLSKNLKIKICRTIISPIVYGCETWSLQFAVQKYKDECIQNFACGCTGVKLSRSHLGRNVG